MARTAFLVFIVLGLLALRPTHAQAASVCQGRPAESGRSVRGPILEIIDARTVCVALSPDPADWAQVTLIQPALSRPALMAAAFGKTATCVVGDDGRAECVVDGAPLTTLLSQPTLQKTAARWH